MCTFRSYMDILKYLIDLMTKKKREKLLQIFSPENCYMQQINTCNGNSNPTKKNVHRAIFVRP